MFTIVASSAMHFKRFVKMCHDFAQAIINKLVTKTFHFKEVIAHHAVKLVNTISTHTTILSDGFIDDDGLSALLDNNQLMPPMIFKKYQDFQRILSSPSSSNFLLSSSVMRPVQFSCGYGWIDQQTKEDALLLWIHSLEFLRLYGPFVCHFSYYVNGQLSPKQNWKFLQRCVLYLPALKSLQVNLPGDENEELLQFACLHPLSFQKDLKQVKISGYDGPSEKRLNGLLFSTCQKSVRRLDFSVNDDINVVTRMEFSDLEEMEIQYWSLSGKSFKFLENIHAPNLTKLVLKIGSCYGFSVVVLMKILHRFKIQKLDLVLDFGIVIPKGKEPDCVPSITHVRVFDKRSFNGSYEFLKYFPGLKTLEISHLKKKYRFRKIRGQISEAICQLLKTGCVGNAYIFELLPSLQQIAIELMRKKDDEIRVVTNRARFIR